MVTGNEVADGVKRASELKAGDRVSKNGHTFVVLGEAVEFRGKAEFAVRYEPPTEHCFYDVWTVEPNSRFAVEELVSS